MQVHLLSAAVFFEVVPDSIISLLNYDEQRFFEEIKKKKRKKIRLKKSLKRIIACCIVNKVENFLELLTRPLFALFSV